ncbi:MAG: nucleotidyltransferase domain-containing protein [Bacteroidota bacterium]|jgi:predicted nucleotidyltransferase
MNYGLSENTINKLFSVFRVFPQIEKVILYGSRATGTFREGSDIDFAVEGNIDYNLLLKIGSSIDELNLPYETDILSYQNIENKELKEQIDLNGIVFFENK